MQFISNASATLRVTAATGLLLIGSACTQTGGYNSGGISKQTGGAAIGAVGGAVAGAQFGKGTGQLAATALGTLLGAFVGSEVGSSLDRADAVYAQQTAQKAFNTGNTMTWQNPQTNAYGTVQPNAAFQAQNGQLCREFYQTVTIDGRSEQAYGTACRQNDGSWKII